MTVDKNIMSEAILQHITHFDQNVHFMENICILSWWSNLDILDLYVWGIVYLGWF